MLAKEVYNKHKNQIMRIAENVKKLPIDRVPQDKVLDKKGNIDVLFTGSMTPAPQAFEIINQITYELRGIHTHCRIIPQGQNDIQMICTETPKEQAIELAKCLEPIRITISNGIKNFAKESIESPQTSKGAITPLLDMVDFYNKFKKEHCKPVHNYRTEMQTKID